MRTRGDYSMHLPVEGLDNILTEGFVLIVEDCMVQRMRVVKILSSYSVTVVAVDCAEAALEVMCMARHSDSPLLTKVAAKHDVDVVLMDVMLPDLTGAELCSSLISRAPSDIPPTVIALSACDATATVRACYEAGATDYIRKPLVSAP